MRSLNPAYRARKARTIKSLNGMSKAKKKRTIAELCRELNKKQVLNVKGEPWRESALWQFIVRYQGEGILKPDLYREAFK